MNPRFDAGPKCRSSVTVLQWMGVMACPLSIWRYSALATASSAGWVSGGARSPWGPCAAALAAACAALPAAPGPAGPPGAEECQRRRAPAPLHVDVAPTDGGELGMGRSAPPSAAVRTRPMAPWLRRTSHSLRSARSSWCARCSERTTSPSWRRTGSARPTTTLARM